MKIQQIRSATNKIQYAGKTFLIDPWLAPKHVMCINDVPGNPFHTMDPVKANIAMPIFDLPESVESILAGVDYYIVTHLHPDHIDFDPMNGTVGGPLDKNTPVICQDEADAMALKASGFADVIVLSPEGLALGDITLTKVAALHGTIAPCGNAMGVILQSTCEKTLYLAGDTIWFEGVKKNLETFKPSVVMVNGAAAELVENGRLIMNDEDIECVAKTAPQAKIYITHMDNVAHQSITRHEMRGRLLLRNINDYLMPEDGESVEL